MRCAVDGTWLSPGGFKQRAQPLVDNRYLLLRRLGQGGQARIHAAIDTRLERRVAVKLLDSVRDMLNQGGERFEREARALSRLRSQHTVRVFDYGISEDEMGDPQPFIVMELVEGEALKSRLSKGPLDVVDAVEVVLQTAEALDEAHRYGIVHRDVKPANVIVWDTVRRIRAVLVDFGVASMADGRNITLTGAMIGSPRYMSPEQVRGEPAGPEADVYALGVMLYNALVGKPPFDDRDPRAIMKMHLQAPVPALPSHVPEAQREALNNVVQKAMAKHADDRYPSVNAMSLALLKAFETLPVFATQQPTLLPRPAGAALWLVGAAAVVLSVLGWMVLAPETPTQPAMRIEPRTQVQASPAPADAARSASPKPAAPVVLRVAPRKTPEAPTVSVKPIERPAVVVPEPRPKPAVSAALAPAAKPAASPEPVVKPRPVRPKVRAKSKPTRRPVAKRRRRPRPTPPPVVSRAPRKVSASRPPPKARPEPTKSEPPPGLLVTPLPLEDAN